jgi:REP element-mobilizing transposase RayT
MAPPLAYFLTWTTYGTWLPGDARGWVDKHQSGPEVPYQAPDRRRERAAKARMKESPVILTPRAREVVEAALRETCSYRGWTVHALSGRTNHVHIVVTTPDLTPGWVMRTLKAYATRALNRLEAAAGTAPACQRGLVKASCDHGAPSPKRQRWWTEDGSKRYINDERSLAAAVHYVNHQ